MSTPARKDDSADKAKSYEVSPLERAAVEKFFARAQSASPSPGLTVSREAKDTSVIGLDHPDAQTGAILLMEALGTTSGAFLDGLLSQLANAATKGKVAEERESNFVLAMVKGIEPKDQVETMLAAQMAAVHNATMVFARRLNHVDSIQQQDSASNAFNKLARTFAAQMEALKRYRTGGEQKVTVQHQHVTVNEGGQAIVGAVAPGGGVAGKSEEQPGAKQITYAPGETLPSTFEKIKDPVSRASG